MKELAPDVRDDRSRLSLISDISILGLRVDEYHIVHKLCGPCLGVSSTQSGEEYALCLSSGLIPLEVES